MSTTRAQHPTGLTVMRKQGTAKSPSYGLGIPAAMGRALVDAGFLEMMFAAELTEDGILFRPVGPIEKDVELPAWAKNGAKP